MNTPTISPKFTLNTNKMHDQLDTLRARLNELARDRGLDDAFDAGVLRDTLAGTDLGRRYRSLLRRGELLAKLPNRRTLLLGAGIYLLARRTGLDKRAARALRRTANALRARLPRRSTPIPAQFTVTPAATTAFGLAGSDTPVTVMTPADVDGGYEPRTGRLITLDDEYFALLMGETPYIFLPDHIAKVGMSVDAGPQDHWAIITLIENPVPLPSLA